MEEDEEKEGILTLVSWFVADWLLITWNWCAPTRVRSNNFMWWASNKRLPAATANNFNLFILFYFIKKAIVFIDYGK